MKLILNMPINRPTKTRKHWTTIKAALSMYKLFIFFTLVSE